MSEKNEFLFYAYNPPTSGKFRINGAEYRYGEDFRNAKRYKEYLDCGFDIVLARYENAYKGEEWEGSDCQLVFKEALKGGCKKILVTDERFDGFIRENDLIGDGKRFASEKELDREVEKCVAPYCNQEGFYGIQLLDEPTYANIPAYGQLVHSLNRVLPGVYLQCNLLPVDARAALLSPDGDKGLQNSADPTVKFSHELGGHQGIYEKYVNDFTDATGLDYVLFDEYAFRKNYIICGHTIPNYQIVARICRQRKLDFYVVLQSFAYVFNGNLAGRPLTQSDMYWQTNLALGFGVKEFAFYTYMTKSNMTFLGEKTGEGSIDGASFINLDGTRTALYSYTKRIIKEMKSFAPVALKYRYESSHIVTEAGKTCKDFDWTKFLYEDEPSPIPVSVDKGVSLITRSTGENGELYMIENIGNVRDELFNNAPPMQVNVSLPDGEKTFYFRGKQVKASPDKNGTYKFSLKVGDAIFAEVKR